MLKIYNWMGGVIFGGIMVFIFIQFASIPKNEIIASVLVFSVYTAMVLIWGGMLLSDIVNAINDQIRDYYTLDELDMDKESYQNELDQYTKEMKAELLTHYRDFEETMMGHVKDSKIIATIIEKSGYSTILKTYNERIKYYISCINDCDRKKSALITQMYTRQADRISGFGRFLPLSHYYKL